MTSDHAVSTVRPTGHFPARPYRTAGFLPVGLLLIVLLVLPGRPVWAGQEQTYFFGDFYAFFFGGEPEPPVIEISETELNSLFCGAAGILGGTATVILTGTAIAVAGPHGVEVSAASVPLIAAAMFTSCRFAELLAPGAAWLVTNSP